MFPHSLPFPPLNSLTLTIAPNSSITPNGSLFRVVGLLARRVSRLDLGQISHSFIMAEKGLKRGILEHLFPRFLIWAKNVGKLGEKKPEKT